MLAKNSKLIDEILINEEQEKEVKKVVVDVYLMLVRMIYWKSI
jgi:hypothetical protein